MVVVDLAEVEERIVVVGALAKDLTIDLDSTIPLLGKEVDITAKHQEIGVVGGHLQRLVNEGDGFLVAALRLID